MNPLRTTTALAALCTGLAAPALADDEIFEIPEIVVSANLGETEASRTGAAVTVLDGDDLDRTGESRLTDLLARQPGIGIRARGPLGTQTGLTIRGVSQNYVKVLYDGIDIADPSSTQVFYDFGRLTSFGLDRVEILRGSQSAVYGSQAIGGVVSLQTALPQEDGTQHSVEVEAGSYGTVWGNYGYGVRSGRGALGLNLSHVATDGYSAANAADGNAEADGYEATRLSLRGETTLGDGVVLGFSGFVEDTTGDYDEQFPLADGSPDEVSTATARALRAFMRFETGHVEHEIAASAFSIDRRLSGTSGFGASVLDYKGRRQSLDWTARMAAGTGLLTFGAGVEREAFENVSGFGTDSNDSRTYSLFGEYDVALSDTLDVTASLRNDNHSEFGNHLTGRLAAAWRLDGATILRFSAGTGFRAPSGYEIANRVASVPVLEPEKSRSVDLGLERRFGETGLVRATVFRIETDNLIDYTDGGTPWPATADDGYIQVGGTTVRQGLELEGETAISERVRLTGAYTFTDSENPAGLSAGNTWSSGFGRHQVSLGLDAELTDRLTAAAGLLHVADRPTLPDYTTVNATFTYDLGDQTEAYLRIENLADTDYELVDGYGTSGRALYVGLRKSF